MPNRALKIVDPFFKTQLVGLADGLLHRANAKLEKKQKAAMGQYMTPSPVSSFMASPMYIKKARELEEEAKRNLGKEFCKKL